MIGLPGRFILRGILTALATEAAITLLLWIFWLGACPPFIPGYARAKAQLPRRRRRSRPKPLESSAAISTSSLRRSLKRVSDQVLAVKFDVPDRRRPRQDVQDVQGESGFRLDRVRPRYDPSPLYRLHRRRSGEPHTCRVTVLTVSTGLHRSETLRGELRRRLRSPPPVSRLKPTSNRRRHLGLPVPSSPATTGQQTRSTRFIGGSDDMAAGDVYNRWQPLIRALKWVPYKIMHFPSPSGLDFVSPAGADGTRVWAVCEGRRCCRKFAVYSPAPRPPRRIWALGPDLVTYR